jgi:hypothetical protein
MCFNESKHLSHMFPTQNGLKQEDALAPLLYNAALGRSKKTWWD